MALSFQSFIFAIVGPVLFTSAVAIDLTSNAFTTNDLVRNSSDFNIINRLQTLRQIVQINGCKPNVCFIVQGGASISPIDFQTQRNFVNLIANIITTDDNGGLCAVQYGGFTRPISPLTDDRDLFIDRLEMAQQVGGSPPNLIPALKYARAMLRRRPEDANKIVLLTNLLDPRQSIESRTSLVNSLCNLPICVVSVQEIRDFLANVQAAESRETCPLTLFRVNDFFLLLEIIQGLVFDICNIPAKQRHV